MAWVIVLVAVGIVGDRSVVLLDRASFHVAQGLESPALSQFTRYYGSLIVMIPIAFLLARLLDRRTSQ